MRIGIVVWSLFHVKGGIERLGCNLANAMRNKGHEVVLFYNSRPANQNEPVYPLDAQVQTRDLCLNTPGNAVARAREIIVQSGADLVCGLFSWDALLWFPAIMNNTGIPFIVSEHNLPHIIETERWNRYERLACLASADQIHLLFDSYKKSLPDFLHPRTVVIPNPALPPRPVKPERDASPVKTILAVGRLTDAMKQFSLLIRAFALLSGSFPEWQVELCGDGEDAPLYKNLVSALHLENRVILHGRVDDVAHYYEKSHIFCIPSQYEGFGLVTTEAQAHGLPAVGFAQCSGTNELISHANNGILVDEMTPEALAAGLRVLMKNAELRKTMGLRAQESVLRFDEEAIYTEWEALFRRTVAKKGDTVLMFSPQKEEERIMRSVEEVALRPHPFVRPGCDGHLRHMAMLESQLRQALNLIAGA